MENNLFDKLNEPFPYNDYKYNKDDDVVYIKGQAVAERLNKVLGVSNWCYLPIFDSIKSKDTGRTTSNKTPIIKLLLLLEFKFRISSDSEWVSFVDAGSQDMNRRMEEGDATKSAITDAFKKCASRIGVASDVYKGLLKGIKENNHPNGGYVLLPQKYKTYYDAQGWEWPHESAKTSSPYYKKWTDFVDTQKSHVNPATPSEGNPDKRIKQFYALLTGIENGLNMNQKECNAWIKKLYESAKISSPYYKKWTDTDLVTLMATAQAEVDDLPF